MRGGRGGGGGRGPGRVSLYTAASVASKVGFGLLVFFAAVGVYETVPRMFGRGSIAASLVAPRDRFLARGPVAGSGNLRAGPAAGDPYGPVVDGVVGGGGGDGGGGGEDSSSTSSSSGSSSGGGGDDACPPNDPYCHHPGGAGEAKPSNNNVNVDGGEEVTPPSQPAAVAPPPSGPVANPDYVPVAVPRPDGWVPAQRPLADGSERAVTAMAAGAAVVSDFSPLLAEEFGAGRAIAFFRRADPASVVETLASLEDPAAAQTMADAGRARVAEAHTWPAKAAALVEALRT